jgi:mannose-6-phosphate isomerase-like protein (cupin superfamily)
MVFVKPNKWLESKYARPYYDVLDRTTGKKVRLPATDLWNATPRARVLLGPDYRKLAYEIVRREKELDNMKEEYLDLYNTVKQRYDAGMKIPKAWMGKLEEMFDQMYQKDASLGQFSEGEDTLEGAEQTQQLQRRQPENSRAIINQPIRNPITEAPHTTEMPEVNNLLVDEDEYYQGMDMKRSAIKLIRACDFLINLEKDDAMTAGMTPVRSEGYLGNDIKNEKPLFAQQGAPVSTKTEGYRNPLYSKKKKQKGISPDGVVNKADGFVGNIESLTNTNENFRKVIYTGKHSQLVLMKLLPGEDIGMEVHESVDQFFRVDSGEGTVVIDGKRYRITDGTGIVVPAGAEHNVINSSKDRDLKLYTIYSPPEHKDGTIRATKQEAEAQKEEFDGKTTEQ